MIINNKLACPVCGEKLKYYDKVKRIVRTKGGISRWVSIRRFVCVSCVSTHRELPNYLLPYKQYETSIIRGFLSGELSSFDLEYEDYPCETTIKQWRKTRN